MTGGANGGHRTGDTHDPDSRDGVDDELAALADGTLEPARARELRAQVAADPRLLARYGALRAAALAAPPPVGPAASPAPPPAALPSAAPSAASPAATPAATSAATSAATPAPSPAPASPPTPAAASPPTPAAASLPTPAAASLDGAPRPERPTTRARVAVVAVAAVLVVGAVIVAARLVPDPPAPASAADVTPVVALPADRLGTLWPDLGLHPADLGFLTEQHRIPDCFGLLDPPQILGARPVVVDGRYGVAVALAAPGDRVQVVVYGRDCDLFDDAVVARTSVPR